MLLAVTGTPGTGKTAVCEKLARSGYSILDLGKIIRDNSLFIRFDEVSGAYEVDTAVLLKYFHESDIGKDPDRWIMIDSHLSHTLTVSGIVLLRCNPDELGRRLRERDYTDNKIRANVESELVDVIGMEVISRDLPSIEIDTTEKDVGETADEIVEFIRSFPNTSGFRQPCAVNWIGEIYEPK